MLYCYATSVNTLVIAMDRTRYKINRKDICNILVGVGRQGRVPRRPRSGHDVTGLDINLNLDFPEAQVGREAALNSEAVIWLRTAA